MKVLKMVQKLYKAILLHDKEKEKELYFKLLKKSLKHKHTEIVGK